MYGIHGYIRSCALSVVGRRCIANRVYVQEPFVIVIPSVDRRYVCIYTHARVCIMYFIRIRLYRHTQSILVRELRTVSYILHCTRTTPRKGQNTKLIRIRDSLAPVPSERLAREKNLRIYI